MTTAALEHFRHFRVCPRCGTARSSGAAQVPFRCERCGFVLFFNAAAAVAVFVTREDGQVLFIRRAKDPAKGRLGLPGGFADFGESAEDAVRREAHEEVGLELRELAYLNSFPNVYAFEGVTYHTLDIYFTATADAGAEPRALDAVEDTCWIDPHAVDLDEIAFPSMRAAVVALRRQRHDAGRA
jgi:ADP-ribose pyrophosphatase YjhB (NUDIX family)